MTTSHNKMSDVETKHKLEIMLANYQANGQSDWSFVYDLLHLIKQHREAYALELIGDDEKVPESIFEYSDDDQRKYWYNKLRAQLREKVGRDHTK